MSKPVSRNGRDQYRFFWEEFCADSYQRLISYGRKLANGNTQDAEDLVQETIYRALMYSGNPHQITNPFGYLAQIMRNAWNDQWRREHKIETFSLDGLLGGQDTENNRAWHTILAREAAESDSLNDFSESIFLIDQLHHQLNERERLYLQLRCEGRTYGEIAKTVGVSEAAARQQGSRLRRKLVSFLRPKRRWV
jgi:RNA polymerase sigma factor (sigma-70 family)